MPETRPHSINGSIETIVISDEELALEAATILESQLQTQVIKSGDALLASDWTQLPDSGLTSSCKTAYATYRAALRAIRSSDEVATDWPAKPELEWA